MSLVPAEHSAGRVGHPGDAQSPLTKHHHIFHPLGSGRTAVLVESLSRDEIFDALMQRRCYATTGGPIIMDVRLADAVMGQELPPITTGHPVLRIRCIGTNGIDQVRIVRNGRVAKSFQCYGEETCELEWADEAYDPSKPACYYVRLVQVDLESAWSSPIFVG